MRSFLLNKLRAITIFVRKIYNYSFFKSNDIILHSNVVCRFKPEMIKIGKRLVVLNGAIFEFNNSAKISIGDYCTISYGALIAVKGNFKIGSYSMVGEYTSIRDYSHDYSVTDISMAASKDLVKDITIGSNVWIGRGCIILPGCTIENGVVVGANSVIKGHLKENGIYAGNPARFVKSRI